MEIVWAAEEEMTLFGIEYLTPSEADVIKYTHRLNSPLSEERQP